MAGKVLTLTTPPYVIRAIGEIKRCVEEYSIKAIPSFTLAMAIASIRWSPGILAVGQVFDRSDGKLVHLDGLNFSRAWVLYGLAEQYPEFSHLNKVADHHIDYSLPNLVGDSYEGGHWLGSFAINALLISD